MNNMKDQALARPMFAQMAQSIDNLEQQIDNAEDYAGIMNAIRGDEATVAERRQELGGLVGKKDANKTPESVLTLIQPTLGIMETVQEGGVSADGVGITSGLTEQAPGQAEAKARIAMGEQPVRRASGSTGAEDIATKLSGLTSLIPEPQGYETYLKQYQDVLGDTPTGFEFNPVISGLNLASAIANAPRGELLSTILSKETIKDVGDPILQMAQAKSKQDQALKLKALDAETAAKTSAAQQKSNLLKTALPKLLESDDITVQIDGTGQPFIVNKTTGETTPFGKPTPTEYTTFTTTDGTVYNFNKQTGEYKATDVANAPARSAIKLGDGRTALIDLTATDPTKNIKYLGTKKVDDKYEFKNVGGGVLVSNKQTGTTEFKTVEGMPVDFEVYGSAESGFFKVDKNGTVSPITADETGVSVPLTDFQREIKQFKEVQAKLLGMDPTDEGYAETLLEFQAFSEKYTPVKDSEFERIANANAERIYQNTEGTEQDKQAAKNEYLAKTYNDYVVAKSTVTQNYNPNEALDKEFANIFGKQVAEIGKGAENADKLAKLSNLALAASDNFKTGAFAETRLNIIKMTEALGGVDIMRSALGEERFNRFFKEDLDNVASGELLQSVGSQFAIMMAEAFPGNLNQSEVDLIIKAAPNIGVSRKGLETLNAVFNAANNRAQLEAKYTSEFLQDPANQGLGAEAKYAKYNDGLREIRAANKVITEEIVNTIEAEAQGALEVPDGGIRIKQPDGGFNVLTANQAQVFEVAKNNDLNDFLAKWPDLTTQYPEFADDDPQATYQLLKGFTRVN